MVGGLFVPSAETQLHHPDRRKRPQWRNNKLSAPDADTGAFLIPVAFPPLFPNPTVRTTFWDPFSEIYAGDVQGAMKPGARAYLLKTQLDKELLGTIRAVQSSK